MTRHPRVAIAETGDSLIERCLKNDYAASVERAGGAPAWIRGVHDADAALLLADECDGFVFPGGSDIDPALYGQKPSPRCGKPDPERDRSEPLLLEAALRAGKPVLGICRGFHLINIAMGGTLHQDLGTELPASARRHFRATRIRGTAHAVEISAGSLLERCVGTRRLEVNSVHHQAVARIADSLTPTAFGDDGIVEALESSGYPFLLGVQWHPELLAPRRSAQQALFDALVEAAARGV
jgi:putative glutamine amidotransferase